MKFESPKGIEETLMTRYSRSVWLLGLALLRVLVVLRVVLGVLAAFRLRVLVFFGHVYS